MDSKKYSAFRYSHLYMDVDLLQLETQWYEKGHRNMFDIIQAVKNGMKLTEQQTMGKL